MEALICCVDETTDKIVAMVVVAVPTYCTNQTNLQHRTPLFMHTERYRDNTEHCPRLYDI